MKYRFITSVISIVVVTEFPQKAGAADIFLRQNASFYVSTGLPPQLNRVVQQLVDGRGTSTVGSSTLNNAVVSKC